MNLNMNEFLSSISNTLDAIEMDLFGVPTNHSKRIAYIASRIGTKLKLKPEEIFDLASLSLLHDNGATMKVLDDRLHYSLKQKIELTESRKEHCTIGENNLREFPLFTPNRHVILYHHENYDGSGFFGIEGDAIPLFAQIIHIADALDLKFEMNHAQKEIILNYVKEHTNTLFAPAIGDVFLSLGTSDEFWNALHDENIDSCLREVVPVFAFEMSYRAIRNLTKTLSHIIDAKSVFTQRHSSGLSNRMLRMAKYYKFDMDTRYQLLIATDLHDLGKLSISNSILDKPGKLTVEEFAEIKKHPVITRQCLQGVKGFERITVWASTHHEKMDGSGYPDGLQAKDLDFNSRLIAALDIYQALREKRPYRKTLTHVDAMHIIDKLRDDGKLDDNIVLDIHTVFSPKPKR